MSRHSLSIFSFKTRKYPGITDGSQVALWVLASLALIDVLINFVFGYPADPSVTTPSKLQEYFEYGRSVEGKLARMTRPEKTKTAPITLAGWYEPLRAEVAGTGIDKPIVTFYGMSHAVQLAHALQRTSDKLIARAVGAPGATANWAYGAFLRDRVTKRSRVVVLALMSANLPMITTVSPMTWNIDSPMPYTADRFYIDGDGLRAARPMFSSFEQYVEAFYDRTKWEAYRKDLTMNDTLYDHFVIKANIFDHSSLVRLVRRAYGQRLIRNARHAVLDQSGFHDTEQIRVANVVIKRFAELARADGALPVIYIVNNLGYSNYLFQAVRATLEANDIPYVSSDSIASPSDPRKYLPDSHFTDETDDQIARALTGVIEKNL
jgi:hypothetical protein